MSRPSQQQFKEPLLADLLRQLRFAPPDKRREQVRCAEKLHDEIEPQAQYPFEYLKYRITRYRTESQETALLAGERILPDLRLLIDHLSRSAPLPWTADERVETVAQAAARLNVSTKTIDRWRQLGLRWRWFIPSEGGRRRMGLCESAIQHFRAREMERMERAARFSQMNAEDRVQLLARARQMAVESNLSPHQVARRLARGMGRAVETIRLLLERHDRDHPEQRIFVDHTGPLTDKQKRVIVRAHSRGVSPVKIARHFRRSTATIHRVLREQRAEAIRLASLKYVSSPRFALPDAETALPSAPLEPSRAQPQQRSASLSEALAAIPEPMRPLYLQSPLDDSQRHALFLQYNYLKYRAWQLRQTLDRYNPRASTLDQLESWLEQVAAIRNRLVAAHLPVVLVAAHQRLARQDIQSVTLLLELLEVGQEVLIESLEKFDVEQGGSFESTLSYELMNRFRRYQPRGGAAVDGRDTLQRMRATAEKAGVRLSVGPHAGGAAGDGGQ